MRSKKLQKFKFGIIGYGSIGKVHKINLEKLGYKFLIYDPKIKVCSEKFTNNIKKINEFCSAVIISSPSNTHLKYLKYFIKKKKHIFIEKPFTHDVKKANIEIKKALKNKIIIALNYNLRARKSILLLKKILLKVKKIYWSNFLMSSNVLNWRKKYQFQNNYTHNRVAGGIIFDSIHEIDLNNFLFDNVEFKNSLKSNFDKNIFKNSSYASINLNIDNKFYSTIQLDYKGFPDQRKIKLLTNKGLIKVDIKKNFLKIINKKNKTIFYKKYNADKYIDYRTMLKNFILCVINKSNKPLCNALDGIKNVKLAIKANE